MLSSREGGRSKTQLVVVGREARRVSRREPGELVTPTRYPDTGPRQQTRCGEHRFTFANGGFVATVRLMIGVVKFLLLVTMGVWVGSIVFFSFVQAPTVFRTLDAESAARLQRATFPHYYLLGIVCAALGIVWVATLLAVGAMRLPAAALCLLLLAAGGAANLWMRQGVAPQMARVREQRVVAATGSQEALVLEREWKTLHRLSVQVNGAVLVSGLVVLGVLVWSRIL